MVSKTLPRVFSPALLNYVRSHPQLPSHSWYFIAGVTLSVLNRSDEIPIVFQQALEKGGGKEDTPPEHAEQLMIARKMREGLVKSAAIGGLPKVREELFVIQSRKVLRVPIRLTVRFPKVHQRPLLLEDCNPGSFTG